jgi:signal transduction histidine kinase
MNLPEGYNEKPNQILEVALSIRFSEPQKAIELANFAYVHSLKSSDEILEAKSLYALGVCNELVSNYPQAMKFLTEAIKLSQHLGERRIMGDALNCVGIINDNLNDYSNALKAYLRALKIYENLGEYRKIAIVHSNIGLIYTNIKDYKNALKFYSRALDIAEEENDEESLLVTNINIGLTHNLLGNYGESLKFLNDSLELAGKRNDKNRASIALDHLAETYLHLGNHNETYRLLEESMMMKLELDDGRGLVKIYSKQGQLQLLENNVEEAKLNLRKALDLADELGMKKSVFELHKSFSEAFERSGDTPLALHHLKLAYSKELEFLREEAEAKARKISTQLEIEQAQKEAEIQRLRNVELAKALEDVKKLNIELKNLNDEKNEFMAIAVHDLKNPLMNILSTARILKRRTEISDNEKNELTDNLISQTDRMFNLIKKLLDHNAIEQGELKIKNTRFDVNEICSEIASNFRESAEKKNIALSLSLDEIPMELNTDKDILYEILQNLISNSIKFSQPGKCVSLRTYHKGNSVKFEVKDEGPGFSDSDKKKMFNKFSRLSAKPTGDEHSTGLGLSIVKKLCDMLGADIQLESEEKKGAQFTISLAYN